ncbi:hypothetical protein KIH27_08965 [Mycobacterium sp. M1]|uniref:VWA domain-containing protein n=1 Tax=Mycolicibacter acidiphilus TaxID=2835306 RepID=A0ABS5RHE0_9MYCO|nr:hypothetical protein [Mycolicibacter acidiphilus]MBS9533715.1 hypothetical protein [Mycolicibacter acidiphilus]
MPIYVVNGRNQHVTIPAGPLSVSITGSVNAATLELDTATPQQVVRTSAHQAVLPELTGPVTIAVRPVGSSWFPAGTVVHLAITRDVPDDPDPFQVLLDPVDIGGEAAVGFAELSPNGRQIDVAVNIVADVQLSPLAAAARTSARRIIGRGGAQTVGDLVVALDTSASMRPWFENGSAAAATDVVVGVADALGIRQVSAVLVGGDVTPVGADAAQPVPAGGLAEAVRAAQPRWSAGARWSRLAPGTRAVVCSDFPTSGVRQRFPVIALSHDTDYPGTRLPGPRPGQDATAELLAHPQVLDKVAAGLVQALT